MSVGWYFEKIGKMGGAHDGAYRNPLGNSGLLREHRLAREAIQNSVDARREDGVVRVHFRKESVDKIRIDQICEDLSLLSDLGPVDRGLDPEKLGLAPGNFFDASLDAEQNSQQILFIEDYGTLGLGGKLSVSYGEDDRYYKLVLGFGVSDDSEQARGGSFGFGKSVYPDASNVNTVVYYSVFDPTEETEHHHARLIVASIFKTHTYKNANYNGRAWFGNLVDDDFCAPLLDDAAHEFADKLGFRVRSETEYGTSMMILGSDLNLQEVRTGVENHWWPRLIDEELSVEFSDNREKLPPPAPGSKSELSSYIRCYQAASKQTRVDEGDIECRQFSKSDNLNTGWCAITVADRDTFPEDNPALEPTLYPGINEVALIRSPKMVVSYQAVTGSVDIVGVFVADNDIDWILKLSEPPDHTRWARDSNRLKEDSHKTLVQGIPNRIKRVVDSLRRRVVGDAEKPSSSPRALEEHLGEMFRTPGGGEDIHNPSEPSIFDVSIHTDTNSRGDTVKLNGRVAVKCKESGSLDEALCKVIVSAVLLQDDTRRARADEALQINIISLKDPKGHEVMLNDELGCVVLLNKKDAAEILFETSEYDAYAACSVFVNAELVE